MAKGPKDTHLTLLPLGMSIRDIEEEENLPAGAPKVSFVHFHCFRTSNSFV